MKRTVFHCGFMAAALGAAALAAGAQQALPKAETILDKYIEATGGRAAYEKLRSDVRTATMEVAGQGRRATITIYRAAPNKMYTVMEMAGVGKIEDGTDGETAWSLSAIQGPRVKEGDEKAFTLLGAAFNGELRWREFYKSAETAGVEEVDGKPCYKLVLTSNAGLRQTRYYDKETGLLVKTQARVKTQMGELDTENISSDYRKVDGILMPHKTVSRIMGQELVLTLESVKTNVEIDPSRFSPPEEIKALLAKEKKD